MRTAQNDFIILLTKKVKLNIINTIIKNDKYLKDIKRYSDTILNSILIFLGLTETNNIFIWKTEKNIFTFNSEGIFI